MSPYLDERDVLLALAGASPCAILMRALRRTDDKLLRIGALGQTLLQGCRRLRALLAVLQGLERDDGTSTPAATSRLRFGSVV